MEKQAFISYASEDVDNANSICRLLEEHGVRCWIAPRDITPGASYAEEIIKAIERTTALVLVMSENANNSPHVGLEVERAVSKAKTVFPVRIRECTPSKRLEYFVSGSQWIDAWASPLEVKVKQLANAIRALSETGRVTGTGEWKLGTEPSSQSTTEPPTRSGAAATAEIPPARSDSNTSGVLLGAGFGLFVLLGAGFYLTRQNDSAVPKVDQQAKLPSVSTKTSVSGIVTQPAPSAQLAMNSASASPVAETALSLAIEKSLKEAETKIFSSRSAEQTTSAMPLTTAATSFGMVATSQKEASSQSIIDPALPLPKERDASSSLATSQPSSRIAMQQTTMLAPDSPEKSSVAAVTPKPIVRQKPPKPKEPVYPTVRSAKLAYKAGAITKYKYKEIVGQLEETYDTNVRRLKTDYRAGKISRDEYGRRVRELKLRIYG